MFKVTAAAAKQIQHAAREGGTEGMALRMAAERKPDGSLHYMMGFDDRSDTDISVVSEGVEIVISPAYKDLLNGTTLDFVEIEPGDHRFIFMNPNDANYSQSS
ncbi:MAG: iron-sulfur cluster assembly accessory protein [Chromatiales bacterium]|nr:iron-sulfur cluster assembly accessory protein [Chromatiales bacterium]